MRAPRTEDLREFVALRQASRAFLEPWEPAEPDGTDRFSERWAARFLAPAKSERRAAFLICASDDGKLLGALSFFHIERGAVQSAQVGYWVGAAHADRGVMGRALELALAKAFGSLELQRVEALIVPENEPSRRLVQRTGFQLEGLARGYAELGGRRRDHERWSLTRAEWLAKRERSR
ncbi:MAG: GNAT family N-acetyltransferase [Planctomycetes bacterium]|nr:GNAT family N-acetyltransferase [Planctomycetota bacterium]